MGVGYKIIDWNSQKKKYDFVILIGIILYLIIFISLHFIFYQNITFETLLIRSTGSLALLMLHIILIIGPLSRFIPQAKILLYNRRHLGVSMFFISAIHGVFSIIQYHGGGNKNPFISLFTSNTDYFSFANFPFMVLGFISLIILFFMAVTSHDFWLNKLSPKVWKKLHQFVYIAYVLLIFHVLLGTLQNEKSILGFIILGIGAIIVCSFHIAAGLKNRKDEKLKFKRERNDQFVFVAKKNDIENNKAKLITFKGISVAVYKKDDNFYAVDNFCKHQGGPLSEGKIIDGCITCPWHGWQYQPEDGKSPPPFEEEVKTYEIKIEGEEVWAKIVK